jgi:low affinity Fe/Cu permease
MGDDIDIVLHSYMDAKIRPTEDEMANMLIGIKALHNARYQKMWQTFEHLIKNKTITNKGTDDNS